MPQIDWLIFATTIGPLLGGVVGAAIVIWAERRPKLISWLGHVAAVRMPPAQGQAQPVDIYTHTVVVWNAGRRSANNVRLGHNYLPTTYTVYPAVVYRVENPPGGGAEIVFPTLVPKEQVTITYLYYPPVTYGQINSYMKSDEGIARIITVLPTPMQPTWLVRTAWVLLLLGVVTALYLLVLLALWLYKILA